MRSCSSYQARLLEQYTRADPDARPAIARELRYARYGYGAEYRDGRCVLRGSLCESMDVEGTPCGECDICLLHRIEHGLLRPDEIRSAQAAQDRAAHRDGPLRRPRPRRMR